MEYGLPFGTELRFIFSHCFITYITMVQVIGDLTQSPAAGLEFLQREIKQAPVVRFEQDLAARHEELGIRIEEQMIRQAALGMKIPWSCR